MPTQPAIPAQEILGVERVNGSVIGKRIRNALGVTGIVTITTINHTVLSIKPVLMGIRTPPRIDDTEPRKRKRGTVTEGHLQ